MRAGISTGKAFSRAAAGAIRRGPPGPSSCGRVNDSIACVKVGILMSASVPFRDTFWNVPAWAQVALYVAGVIAVAIFAWGLWARARLWRRGLPEDRLDRIP